MRKSGRTKYRNQGKGSFATNRAGRLVVQLQAGTYGKDRFTGWQPGWVLPSRGEA